jgi:hypothetical protein
MMLQAWLVMVVMVDVDLAFVIIYVNNDGREKSSLLSLFIYYLSFIVLT